MIPADMNSLRKEIERSKYFGVSKRTLEPLLRVFGDVALKNGDFGAALDAFIELGDLSGAEKVGDLCIENGGFPFTAIKAFNAVGKLEKFTQLAREGKIPDQDLRFADDEFLKNLGPLFYNSYDKWATELKQKGSGFYSAHTGGLINMVYNLRLEHDIGVGITRGGLPCAYLAKSFGLETKIVRCRRVKKGVSLKWLDYVDAPSFKGKKVIVFDDDAVTGSTSKRVLDELLKYEPASVNIAFNWEAKHIRDAGHTRLENVPSGYGKVFFPSSFDYSNYLKAVASLEKSLK